MKRGQISIFIIIAVVIVGLLVLVLILRENSQVNPNISPDIKPIYNYFEDCIRATGERGIYSIGWSGGYYRLPNYTTENAIPYYYIQGAGLKNSGINLDNEEISLKLIESELSDYMDSMLFYCGTNLNADDFEGFAIYTGLSKTTTKIEDGKVVFSVTFPISITKGKSSYTINNFKVNIDSRLNQIFHYAMNITNDTYNNKGRVCISCINDYAYANDFYVELNDYDNQTTIFTIIDKKVPLMDKEFRFNFAHKYEV